MFIKSAPPDVAIKATILYSNLLIILLECISWTAAVPVNMTSLQGNPITLLYVRGHWGTWTDKAVISPVSCAAPSEVLAIRQENTSQNSVTLLWHEPDQPNGVILEYDIKYYEKVPD